MAGTYCKWRQFPQWSSTARWMRLYHFMVSIIPIHVEPSLPRKRLIIECDKQQIKINDFETGL